MFDLVDVSLIHDGLIFRFSKSATMDRCKNLTLILILLCFIHGIPPKKCKHPAKKSEARPSTTLKTAATWQFFTESGHTSAFTRTCLWQILTPEGRSTGPQAEDLSLRLTPAPTLPKLPSQQWNGSAQLAFSGHGLEFALSGNLSLLGLAPSGAQP